MSRKPVVAGANDTRVFGVWTATALVMGGMIGSAIFIMPGQVAALGWTSFAVWPVAVGGGLLLAWALTRLTRAMPAETGVIAICGRVLGRFPGVLLGWSYWVGIWSANAIIALTAVRYGAVFAPSLAATPLTLAVAAVLLIWLLTLLNLAGARAAGGFQVATTALKVLPLIAVVAIVAGLGLAGGGQFAANPHTAFAWPQFTPALAIIFFTMIGFESAGLAAGRVRDPERTVTRATTAGVALTGALYMIVCSGIVFALPEEQLAASPAPVALFMEVFWGRWAGLATAAFAVVSTVGCLNGWVLLQGEVPAGMARAGLLPAWFGRSNRRNVAVGVLLLASVMASVLVLSGAARGGGDLLDFMLRLTTAATLWLYLGICVAAIRLGVARVTAPLALAFGLWVMWGAGGKAVGLSLLLMASAVPLYWLRPRSAPATAPAG